MQPATPTSPTRRPGSTLGLRVGAALLLLAASCGGAPAPVEAGGIPDSEVPALLSALSGPSGSDARAAVARILEAEDLRFTAVFIELIRAAQIGIAAEGAGAVSASALDALHGTTRGADWPAWVAWYSGTDLEAPPGFSGWKGGLLSRIDESFGDLLRDDLPSRIRVEEVVWGGVAFGGIPALDRPPNVAPAQAGYLDPDEPVFGVFYGGQARAYPHRILDWHEMVNDEVGGVAFSIAYCTLCGSGIAYRSRASDGNDYDFGSSGFLMRSNKLMYDRQTRTLWNQLTGEPVLGSLADGDVELERLPVVVTRWKDWLATHPDTSVLSLDTGHERPYVPGAAYAGYFASPETMFPVRERSRLLPRKARVFGVEIDGVPKAFVVDRLVEEQVVNDVVNGVPLVLVAPESQIRVDGVSVREGPASYLAGAAVRAYRSGERRFAWSEGRLEDEQGRTWRVEEEALVGPDGERAERMPGFLAYWFGWHSYHPRSLVYGAPEPVADAS